MSRHEEYYGTKTEMRFLRDLGEHSAYTNTSRKGLLRKYRDSMRQRKKWGGIDHYAIFDYVSMLIEREA